MTVHDVKRIALQLANTYWVRYYLCLNYPHEPQDVCISVIADCMLSVPLRRGLVVQMEKLGFTWDTKYGITGFHATVEAPPALEVPE
jgi:hypothetical protein